MSNLCSKGLSGSPAVSDPALMCMRFAVMLMSKVSSVTTVPSMMSQSKGEGLISSLMVQSQLMVTLSPGWGRVLFGHWVLLLQMRTKLYLVVELQELLVTGGKGQRYLQYTELISVYSKRVLFLPL